MTWSLLHMPLKAVTSTPPRTISCLRQNAFFKTPKEDNWWPDQVFQDYGVVYAISTTSRQWSHFCVFDSFSKQYFSKYTTSRSVSLLEMPMRQHTNTSKAAVPRFVQFFGCCHVEKDATWGQYGTPILKADFILILTPIITFLNLSQQATLIVASWLFFHSENTWTQNHERILEQLACANTRQRGKTRGGQLSPQMYWSLGDGNG